MPYPVSIVIHLEPLAESIKAMLPHVKSGPMKLWGEPVGRPGEDGHVLIAVEAVNDCLRLIFTDDEVLAVWNPDHIEINAQRFKIGLADAMRYTRYYPDRPKIAENILYRDYLIQDRFIAYRTNEDRVPGSGWMPESTRASFPAIEIGDGNEFYRVA